MKIFTSTKAKAFLIKVVSDSTTFNYRARRREPIITSIPRPIPKTLGQEVPELGSDGWVGPGVPLHEQSVSAVQLWFLQ